MSEDARNHDSTNAPEATSVPRETPAEIEAKDEARKALARMGEAIERGNLIYCAAPEATPGMDCWDWLYGFISTIYALIKRNRLTGLRILFTFDSIARR